MSDPDLKGTILDGRYELQEPIAEGAMGAVWRGERVGLGRAVAVKIMHDALPGELASRERFEREAKLMAKLDHPNCVSVIDYGVHADRPYLVMELVRGTSLHDILEREGHLEPARVVEILRQVLSGLAHAHELGIVHRDIKPANLMVSEKVGIGLQVRILDFGLARPAETTTKLTTGIVVGTPNYMSPEQCKGLPLDGRCDLYACGVILYEALTGKKPFRADDPIQVVRMQLNTPAPKLAEGSSVSDFGQFEDLVARALAKDPGDRYPTAQAMSLALEAALAAKKNLGFAKAPRTKPPTPATPEMATMSGWNVPPEVAATTVDTPNLEPPPPAPAPPPAAASTPPADAPPTIASPPPTMPTRAPASTGLPLSRKQLAIAGGGVLGLIILIAIIAGARKSSSSPSSRDAGATAKVVAADDAPAGDVVGAVVSEIKDRLAAEDLNGALELALREKRQHPDSAELAYITGRVYFAKLYWNDGLDNFREAIRLDPSYRSNPELIKAALRGFITTPRVEASLESFLREDIGAAAIPYLQETAKGHPNATVRARAEAELRRMH